MHAIRVAIVLLDPDDLDGAYAELDRRYAAGEAATYARTWETVQRFARSLHRALQNAELKQRLAAQGIDVESSTPDAFRKHLYDEMAKWAKVIRDAGIQPE